MTSGPWAKCTPVRLHLYDAELGPIESDEQPDPSVLRPVGKVVVRKRSGDTTWDIFSEPSDRPFKPKRVWARRSRE